MRRRAVAVALLACVLVLVGAPFGNAQTAIDADEYLTRLDGALTALRAADVEPAQAIANARIALGLPVAVSLPDGSSVTVTEDSLLGSAADGEDAAAVADMTTRLDAARAGASQARTAPPPDRARIDAAVAAAYGGELQGPSLVQRALSRITQGLGWLLEHTLGALLRTPAGTAIAWVLLIAIAAAAIVIASRTRAAVVGEARVGAVGAGASVIDWRREADDALARGDLNVAVLSLYHVLVGTLATRGIVREAPSLTAGECRLAVRAERPALAQPVDRATTVFERVAYGKQDARPDDVAVLREAEQVAKRG